MATTLHEGDMTKVDAEAGTAGVGGLIDEASAMDRLFAGYVLLSGFALAFPHRPASWPYLAALHLGAAAWAFGVPPLRGWSARVVRRWPGRRPVLAEAYPLLLVPLFYAELAPLNVAVHGGRYFDDVVLRWEELLFGGQPSATLWQAFPFPLLSEVLHGAYLSYYAIIYGPPLILYLSGRTEAFREMIFAVMLTFFAHYVFFIFFPVQGPRYLFASPDGELARGALFRLTHLVLESGSSQGAAFPSAHVGVAFAQTVHVARYLPRLAPWMLALSIALAISTVYGGFHYAIDAIAGLVLGLVCVAIAPRVRRVLA